MKDALKIYNNKISYLSKSNGYFNNVRREVLPLIPKNVDRIFEVGCGSGNTLSFLKESGVCNWVGGIELFEGAAKLATNNIDLVIEGSIDDTELPFSINSIDVILCLDVLEHLVDPWNVIKRMHVLLKPGGVLICSIPNVQHYSASIPLFFLGKWNYSDHGILDKTHLRFFTRKSAVELVTSSGLFVDSVSSTGLEKWSKAGVANMLSLHIFRRLFEFQYLIRAIKPVDD